MKKLYLYALILGLGSLQFAYNMVSLPVMIRIADRQTMAWASDRYASMMEAEYQEPISPLVDIQLKADDLCRGNNICDKTMAKAGY